MVLYKVTFSVYKEDQKRFIKETKYYSDWYLKYQNLDLKREFSKRDYHNVEIETFNIDHSLENSKWHWLNGVYYKEFPMSKGVL